MAYDDYGYYSRFPPKTSAATTRARARTALVALKRKKGGDVAPVVIAGRTIASTFWGKAWCENLERYSDLSNRLPRGRTYVRSGAVVDLRITRGRVIAEVQGSSRYHVEIDIDELPRAEWHALVSDCAGKLASVVELLSGKLPKSVMESVTKAGAGLFPSPEHIHLTCSCPDYATMCKHVAAVLYGVGNRLDAQPELLFTLRHVDANELVGQGVAHLVKTPASKGRALDGDLAAIFGVELEPAPDSVDDRTPQQTTRRTAKTGSPSKATSPKTSKKPARQSKRSRKLGTFAAPAQSTRRTSGKNGR